MGRKLAPTVALVALLAVGCGSAQSMQSDSTSQRSAAAQQAAPTLHAHPQAVEPVAGAVGQASQSASPPSSFSVNSGSGSGSVAQPVSDAQIRQELATSGLSAKTSQAEITPGGLAVSPINAPPAVQNVIDAGNQIAHLPYRFGGGHGTFEDNAYDCSGSLSFVFAAAGLLNTTVTSGQLMTWGKPGPGKWITVFAAPGHTFMYVAGLRFDTVALAETGSRWSNRAANEPDLNSFVVRHPAGL
jgi:cell wall-associated NlpC family hydrolase